MWLVVGLGNPGNEYKFTRHNIGFMAIDYFLQSVGSPHLKNQFKADYLQAKIDNTPVLFCKPLTFMNLSGESVQAFMGFYKIPIEKLIVIHDDIDQPYGQIRLQKNRGHGGHNGIRSISGILGSADYLRIKLGVSRPLNPNIPVVDHVLGKFTPEESETLPGFLNKTCDALESLIMDGLQKASTKFNS